MEQLCAKMFGDKSETIHCYITTFQDIQLQVKNFHYQMIKGKYHKYLQIIQEIRQHS